MRKILEEIINNSKYDTNEEVIGKLWVEMYAAMKREYVYGFTDGVMNVVESARVEGIIIPTMETAGIARVGEEAWQIREQQLDILAIDMGKV